MQRSHIHWIGLQSVQKFNKLNGTINAVSVLMERTFQNGVPRNGLTNLHHIAKSVGRVNHPL